MEYTKECPNCDEIMIYKKNESLKYSIKNNIFCKKCRKINAKKKKEEYIKKYKEKNQEEIRKKQKIYYEKNKKEINEKRKKYRNKNKATSKEKERVYRNKNKNRIKNYNKEYKKKNKERIKQNKKNRRKNPIIKMNNNISGSIRQSLKSNDLSKNQKHWENLVGYSIQGLKDHIESKFQDGMNWDNYGKWHIDHIIPVSFFKFNSTDDVEFKYCWSLNNLQPLWEEDNEEKSDRLILWGEEINARNIN